MTLLHTCILQDHNSVKLCAIDSQEHSATVTNLQVESMDPWNLNTFMKCAWVRAGTVPTESLEMPLFLLTQEFQNSAELFGDGSRKCDYRNLGHMNDRNSPTHSKYLYSVWLGLVKIAVGWFLCLQKGTR